MKRILVFGLIACGLSAASAQTSQSGATLEQLQATRATEETRFLAQERACYERFAVTDCLRQVRRQKRLVLENLQGQEVRLNDLERRKKATEQLERIKEKSSPEKLEEARVRRLEAVEAQNERDTNAALKLAQQWPTPSPIQNDKQKSASSGALRSAEEVAKNKLDFDLKLKEAQERRADREKSLLAKKNDKPVKPLPIE